MLSAQMSAHLVTILAEAYAFLCTRDSDSGRLTDQNILDPWVFNASSSPMSRPSNKCPSHAQQLLPFPLQRCHPPSWRSYGQGGDLWPHFQYFRRFALSLPMCSERP